MRQLRRWLALNLRLALAWSKSARTKVRRSQAQKWRVRNPKSNRIVTRGLDYDDVEHERKLRAVEKIMEGSQR